MEKTEIEVLGNRAALRLSESHLDQNVYQLDLPGARPKILLEEEVVNIHVRRGWKIVAIYRNGRRYSYDGLDVISR